MNEPLPQDGPWEVERYELRAAPVHQFAANRREFVQALGAGLAVAVTFEVAQAQRGGNGEIKLSQRFEFLGNNLLVFTSKVEVGQGSRTQLTQAVAEELNWPLDKIKLVMADTESCPDDGGTAGSRTTPATVPAVRKAAAALNNYLVKLGVVKDEAAILEASRAGRNYQPFIIAELLKGKDIPAGLAAASEHVRLSPPSHWKVLGTSVAKTTGREVVTGQHKYPSDIQLPEMQYGKVLNPPSFGAKLVSIDLAPAEALDEVTVVRDGEFVGCVAKNSWQAKQAVAAIAATAKWEEVPQVSSEELFEHLKKTARPIGSGRDGPQVKSWGPFAKDVPYQNSWEFEGEYKIPYIQHAPLEPRAAVAEWQDGKLTVWTGTQQPGRVVGELKQVFRLNDDQVRVIVPDTGGGFGGKHSGEVAIEAAKLAKQAGKPVSLRWTREEEFTWAYFRPAGLIEVKARVRNGLLGMWYFTNYNAGSSALDTPYEVPNGSIRFLTTDSPLRQGSYRALASTANTFARESAMDELAEKAAVGSLEFRLSHLPDGRLKNVLLAATEKFRWQKGRSTRREYVRPCGQPPCDRRPTIPERARATEPRAPRRASTGSIPSAAPRRSR